MGQNSASQVLALTLLAACFPSIVEGQQNLPKIRSRSSLVVVEVSSQDSKNGLPVRTFTKEDFRVFDNGQEVQISTFDAEARFDTRPMIVWLVAICNEKGKIGGSAEYSGKEGLFRPALDQLDKRDLVGIAHWCDNGEAKIDLPPTEDRDSPIRVLAGVIKPISFRAGTRQSNFAGEESFRKLTRLLIQDAYRRNPQPLPVIVFLDGDHTGQPPQELDELLDDFLKTSGIIFGIKDSHYPSVPELGNGERSEILHYLANQTGGQYLTASPSDYASALELILVQLHFRYELGFIPPAIDGKRHEVRVELSTEAEEAYRGVHLRFRPNYIPLGEEPEWMH